MSQNNVSSLIVRSIAALALMSCAPNAVPSEGGGGDALVGVVRVVGSAPVNVRVVLERPTGGNLELGGPLRDELMALSGAEVEVSGQTDATPDPMLAGTVNVDRYRIVSVNGEPVVTGTIVEIANGRARLRTDAGDELILTAFPGVFRVGQKVWVQGPATMAVQTYGVIRR